MKQNVTAYDFHRAFEQSDSRKDQFSYQGLTAIYDYLIDYEDGTGEEIELDVIAICCEYMEYKSISEYNQDHDYCESISQIQELTTVIPIDTESFIIQQF